MSTATFRFSTDILRRLGEELITSFDQGIVELVKNSYDADARTCTVELIGTRNVGGSVIITDDGDGMSGDDIRDGWLVLGRSRKVPVNRTRGNRLPAGSKGLGRLGALRMGREVLLQTRPFDEPGLEYSLVLRWTDFEQQDVVEDVELNVQRSASELETWHQDCHRRTQQAHKPARSAAARPGAAPACRPIRRPNWLQARTRGAGV